MDFGSLRHLGRLGKPWGHRGEISFQLKEASFADVLEIGVLFVEMDGLHVPFHVSHLREHPRMGAVVKLEDYADSDAVAFLVNREVYAPPGRELTKAVEDEEEDDSLDPGEFMGMEVLDEEHGRLGVITGTEGTDDNPVMVVHDGETEILIPMVDDLITGIDLETGHLVVRTPPGLVELYRNL